jgi:molybdate transport system substrate-binding protein
MTTVRRRRGVSCVGVALAVLVPAVAGCGGGERGRLVVFAASSLTDVFSELETVFEADHPDVDVVLNFGGSSSLATQIEQGAPADVFAAADEATMARAVAAFDPAPVPVTFAGNRLAIAVRPGNPMGITGLDDLARPELVVVLAAPEVPAGAYAAAELAAAGVVPEPDSYEQSVRSVAAKVALGEADVGIVYRTDVVADADLEEVSSDTGVAAVYPIVAITDTDAAVEFVRLVTGPTGRQALHDAGFVLP